MEESEGFDHIARCVCFFGGFLAPFHHLGVSKNMGFYPPKSSILIYFNRVFHYKPSILGDSYFWKRPFVPSCFLSPNWAKVLQFGPNSCDG